mmetsp:Transcript_34305/g.78175  ORF Transcript_34305/g.78175 Transcript_34305/m.78175 type:complete len:293 (-) Transcript_34305:223-1101(-)
MEHRFPRTLWRVFVLLVVAACGLYSGLPAAMPSDVLRYAPVNPPSDTSDMDDFPSQPPVALRNQATSSFSFLHPEQGSRQAPVGMRMRQVLFAASGNKLTVSDARGTYLYATNSRLFTAHDNADVYDAQSGKSLASVWKWLVSLHATYEIETYEPLACTKWSSAQATNASASNVPTYPFLRMTKLNWSWQNHWVVQKYTCDEDVMVDAFTIQERFWPQLYLRLDVRQVGIPAPVATIDQPYLFEMSSHFNIWTGAGSDPSLTALMATVLHMHRDYIRRSRDSGGSRRRNNGR